MGLLWRLFAPKPLKQARRALHPSRVIEDAIVHSVRGKPRPRRQPQDPSAPYSAGLRHKVTGQEWTCVHDHRTTAAATRCAQAMERRVDAVGWEQATAAERSHPGS